MLYDINIQLCLIWISFLPIGCSLPLGLQTGRIPDDNLDASSHYSYMFRSWLPKLARLNQGGSVNAWRPMVKANTALFYPSFSLSVPPPPLLSLSVYFSSCCTLAALPVATNRNILAVHLNVCKMFKLATNQPCIMSLSHRFASTSN